MSKLEEYIKTLTDEERENFKDFIDECLERENQLKKLDLKGTATKLVNSMTHLVTSLDTLYEETKNLQEIAKNKKEEIYLSSLSDDKFFKC